MFYKWYTADAVEDGDIRGSIITRVWFFQSPSIAFSKLTSLAAGSGCVTCNFRLVK